MTTGDGAETARLRFTVLGCGSSPGVPRINGDWGACDPENPKNRRLRCSLLVQRIGPGGITSVVIDTSPDFRQQMLNAGVTRLDGVLYTHPHADHIHGIDDLRGYALSQREQIPVHADNDTLEKLLSAFSYCFVTPEGSIYPPICKAHEIRAGQIVTVEGPGGPVHALPIHQVHGPIQSLGFRFGAFTNGIPEKGGLAYCPDVSDIPDRSADLLRHLDVWIVDALQYRPHVSHFSLGEALHWHERLRPARCILTHMHIPLDYETVRAETPDNVEPAHDGLTIELPA